VVALVLFLFFFSSTALPVIVGSNTAVTVESTAVFPGTDNNNEMRGFGAFSTGFTLENAGVTCTFNSLFPVSRTVTMNDGTLFLRTNLSFDNFTTFDSIGTFSGNTYQLELPAKDVTLSSNTTLTMRDLFWKLNADVTMQFDLDMLGSCTIDGDGHTLSLDFEGSITSWTDALVTFQNVKLTGLRQTNLKNNDGSGKLIFNDTALELYSDYQFTNGSFLIEDDVVVTGTNAFRYESTTGSTIDSHSQLLLDDGLSFTYATANDNLICTDSTSLLYLRGPNFHVNAAGIELTKGRMIIDRKTIFSNDGSLAAEGIVVGDGASIDNNMIVEFVPGAVLELTSGFFVNKNVG